MEDPFCLLCGKVEDKFHYAVCDKLRHHRETIRKRVDTSMEKIAGHNVASIPNFWGSKREREAEVDTEEGAHKYTKIRKFPSEVAARGVIPASLRASTRHTGKSARDGTNGIGNRPTSGVNADDATTPTTQPKTTDNLYCRRREAVCSHNGRRQDNNTPLATSNRERARGVRNKN